MVHTWSRGHMCMFARICTGMRMHKYVCMSMHMMYMCKHKCVMVSPAGQVGVEVCRALAVEPHPPGDARRDLKYRTFHLLPRTPDSVFHMHNNASRGVSCKECKEGHIHAWVAWRCTEMARVVMHMPRKAHVRTHIFKPAQWLTCAFVRRPENSQAH